MKEFEGIEVVIAGDTVPTKSNEILFKNGAIDELFGSECIELFQKADLRVINLETPLLSVDNPVDKFGPSLRANPDTIHALKKLGVNLVSMANNHIRDQGDEGIKCTIQTLEHEGMNYIGAGENIEAARIPFFISKGNVTVGFYSVCETEFSYATESRSGANSLDIFTTCSDIMLAKKKCDHLVVLFHGGREEYRYPTPQEQHLARKMVDAGADVVLAQHSHCIGSSECYHGKYILYGQGNFIFDLCDDDNWKTGLIVRLLFGKKSIDIDCKPIQKIDNKVIVASKEEAKNIISEIKQRSKLCDSEDNVSSLYRDLIREDRWNCLYMFGGKLTANKLFRWLDKVTKHKLIMKLYNKHILLAMLNTVQCETHREKLIESLESVIEKRL